MHYNEFKVLEIVDNKTLLIDYGFNNRAAAGDVLRIIEKGEPVIIDGVNYGTLDMVKDIVEVVVPYDKFSICRKIIHKAVNPLNPLDALNKTLSQLRPLKVDPSDITNRKIPTPTPIKKGDLAILTKE